MKKALSFCLLLFFFIDVSNAQLTVELVKHIRPGSESAEISLMNTLGDKFVFAAFNEIYGKELWISDGTEEGTRMIKDINPGLYGAFFYDKSPSIEYKDRLYFEAYDGHSFKLWVTDGTTEGTMLFKDIYPSGSTYVKSFYIFNDLLFFTAYENTHGRELWVTDGTEEGTHLLKDINPGIPSSGITWFYEFNDQLFFAADDGVHGSELWVTDGTEEGTVLFMDINDGEEGSGPTGFHEFNGLVYFKADDGIHGAELWVTDGTVEGTMLFMDINEGPDGAVSAGITTYKDKMYFSANDGIHGGEVWSSDGTVEGTNLFKEIKPGSGSGYPSHYYVSNDKLFFSAEDGVHGIELWISDGTEEETYLFADLKSNNMNSYPYTASSVPKIIGEVNGYLYFMAFDDEGDNLWVTDGNTFSRVRPEYYNVNHSTYHYDFIVLEDVLYFPVEYVSEIGYELYKVTGTPVLGIEDNDSPIFSVYPNPTNDVIIIECENRTPFALYDILGKKIDSFEVHGKKEISISHLKTGIYILKDMNTGMVKKLVKE